MKHNFQVFTKDKWNNLIKSSLITEIFFNNAKNASISSSFFKQIYGFYSRVFHKKNVNTYFESNFWDKIATKTKKLNTICQLYFYYTKIYKNCYSEKSKNPRNYALSNEVWLNNKYIQIKHNFKIKTPFLDVFTYSISFKYKYICYNYPNSSELIIFIFININIK